MTLINSHGYRVHIDKQVNEETIKKEVHKTVIKVK